MRDALERIAERVHETLRSLPMDYERGRELCVGADGTPTLCIDKVAEDVIVEEVDRMRLPVNILSEEAGFLDRGHEKTLVIDPIDGTHNSVMGIPIYSVSLAVGTASLSDIECGLVRNLVNDDVYWAERGKGSSLNGHRLRVRENDPRSTTFLVYMGRYAHPHTMRVAKRAVRCRSLGCASLEMCMVAEGRADAHYMNTEVHEKAIRVVDIAASALILREAGGELFTLDMQRLDMPLDLKARSSFIALGDLRLKEVFT